MTSYEQRQQVIKLRAKQTLKSLRPTHYKHKPARGLDPLVVFILEEIDRQGLSEQRVAVRAGLATDTIRYWRTNRCREGKMIGVQAPSLPNIRAVINTLGFDLSVIPKDMV